MTPEPEQISIHSDKHHLIILRYTPDGTPHKMILIVPAMAVKQLFYAKLAQYLTGQGYLVYSLDYSGIGLSKSGSIRDVRNIDITDWIRGVDRVIASIRDEHPHIELVYLSHSLGGQIFGLLQQMRYFDQAIIINSQNGYWRYYGRILYPLFWYVLVPFSSWLFGYFPSKIFGMGEPVPKSAMLRWKKWCTEADYLFSDEELEVRHPLYRGEMLALSFTDDSYAPLEAVKFMIDKYSGATITHKHIDPQDVGMQEIGHFGFFREKSSSMWSIIPQWLERGK